MHPTLTGSGLVCHINVLEWLGTHSSHGAESHVCQSYPSHQCSMSMSLPASSGSALPSMAALPAAHGCHCLLGLPPGMTEVVAPLPLALRVANDEGSPCIVRPSCPVTALPLRHKDVPEQLWVDGGSGPCCPVYLLEVVAEPRLSQLHPLPGEQEATPLAEHRVALCQEDADEVIQLLWQLELDLVSIPPLLHLCGSRPCVTQGFDPGASTGVSA